MVVVDKTMDRDLQHRLNLDRARTDSDSITWILMAMVQIMDLMIEV